MRGVRFSPERLMTRHGFHACQGGRYRNRWTRSHGPQDLVWVLNQFFAANSAARLTDVVAAFPGAGNPLAPRGRQGHGDDVGAPSIAVGNRSLVLKK
jgi:hypothetical protein